MSLYAEVHPPTLYESTASMNGTSSVIINSTTDNPQLFSITAAASTIRAPLARFPSTSITLVTNGNSSTSTNASVATTGSLPGRRPEVHSGKNQSQQDADVAGIISWYINFVSGMSLKEDVSFVLQRNNCPVWSTRILTSAGTKSSLSRRDLACTTLSPEHCTTVTAPHGKSTPPGERSRVQMNLCITVNKEI